MSDLSKLFPGIVRAHEPMTRAASKFNDEMRGAPALPSDAAAMTITMESYDAPASAVSTMESISSTIGNLFVELHDTLAAVKRQKDDGSIQYTPEALQERSRAAFAGFAMASDRQLGALRGQKMVNPPSAKYGAKAFTVGLQAADKHDNRVLYTQEAFNNYDMDNSRTFSALFNYSIVDFDEFTRTFWRPVTISPENTFVELLVNVLTVFNGIEQRLDGQSQPWGRRNLVRAVADHTILHTDLTRAIPALRPSENEEFFMTKVTPEDIVQAGKPITTAPLLAGASNMNLIALAQPEWLINKNTLDQRDGLDPGARLDQLYLALENDVIKFEVNGIAGTEFNEAPQGDQQRETLSWTTSALVVDEKTKNVDGTDLTDLASVVSGNLRLAIRINVQVDLNIETGDLVFEASKPVIRTLLNSDGSQIAKTDARYTAIETALKAYTEIGFVIEAYRSNADRRQRGQLINIRQFAENVVVPWRDPIAAERPAAGANEQDASDLTALISATRVRVQNESVTALLKAEGTLASTVVDETYDSFEAPSTLGTGRHYVLPYYNHIDLDALKIVDSLSSAARETDIQAAIVSNLRNAVAVAYTQSQYKAASDALSGGTAPKPKVALVTDPVIARYIIEPGELRTLVDFELIVVPILDFRMRGKMKAVFITADGGDVNFLNFGYLFWSPEHVLVANMTRNGAYNRETQVQPRYRHYVACPVLLSFTVTNIDKALAKISLNVNNTPQP